MAERHPEEYRWTRLLSHDGAEQESYYITLLDAFGKARPHPGELPHGSEPHPEPGQAQKVDRFSSTTERKPHCSERSSVILVDTAPLR